MGENMCLIFFSYNLHETNRLIIAANRDEFYDRPTKPLDFWKDMPYILGGQDLKSRGTWMGVTRSGRLAAITNFRDPASAKTDAPSRGLLVSNFLSGNESPECYLEPLRRIGDRYNGFNLLVGDRSGLFCYSSKGNSIQKIEPGLFGLSNHLLNTPWPKVKKGIAELKPLLAKKQIDAEAVFQVLGNREYPPDSKLPDTGVGLAWERILSPLFVVSEIYGTRSSSIILMEKTGRVTFTERTFFLKGQDVEYETRKFIFQTEI